MIDPLTAIIQLLRQDAGLMAATSEQIGAKHRFLLANSDRAWTVAQGRGALQMFYAAGRLPDLDLDIQSVRLEARAYGISQDEANAVWRRLVEVSRATLRTVVTSGDGQSLVYFLAQDSGPEFGIDPEINIDMIRQFYRADVCELEP